MDVLVLNAACQPVGRISWKKAITLWYLEKVEIIEEYSDKWINSPSISRKMPSIIKLIKNFFFKRYGVKFTRKGIFNRDQGICQYCSIELKHHNATLDHVLPKSRGGKKTWENVVLSCKKCNQRKKEKTPIEANMKLVNKPVKPRMTPGLVPDSWENWININK